MAVDSLYRINIYHQFARSLRLWPQMRAPEAISVLHKIMSQKATLQNRCDMFYEASPAVDYPEFTRRLITKAADLHHNRGIKYPQSELSEGISREWKRNLNAAAFIMLCYFGEITPDHYSQENRVLDHVTSDLIDKATKDRFFMDALDHATHFFFDHHRGAAYSKLMSIMLSSPEKRQFDMPRLGKKLLQQLNISLDMSMSPLEQSQAIVSRLKKDFKQHMAGQCESHNYDWLSFGIGLPRITPPVLAQHPYRGYGT